MKKVGAEAPSDDPTRGHDGEREEPGSGEDGADHDVRVPMMRGRIIGTTK